MTKKSRRVVDGPRGELVRAATVRSGGAVVSQGTWLEGAPLMQPVGVVGPRHATPTGIHADSGGGVTVDAEDFEVLVTFLESQPTAIGRLLAAHHNDGHGKCVSCGVGAQRGYSTWPCTIYQGAASANKRRGALR